MMALVATGGMALLFLGKIPLPASPQVTSTVAAPVSAHVHTHGESMPMPESASDSTPAPASALQPGATLVTEPEPAVEPKPTPAPTAQVAAAPAPTPAPVSKPVVATAPAPVSKPAATPVPAAVQAAATAPTQAECGPQDAFPAPSWYEEGWKAALSEKWEAAFDVWKNGLQTLPKNRAVIVAGVYSGMESFASNLNNATKQFPAMGVRQQGTDGQTSYRLVVCPYGGAIPGKMLPEVQKSFPGAWLINGSSL